MVFASVLVIGEAGDCGDLAGGRRAAHSKSWRVCDRSAPDSNSENVLTFYVALPGSQVPDGQTGRVLITIW